MRLGLAWRVARGAQAPFGPSVSQLARTLKVLKEQVAEIVASFPGETYAVPIRDLAIILNPTSEPEISS
ncbi:hypothetical protein MES5069_760001 [Mesorhizobium escarrei]|uniref:Uncharacterized protein n=1 Tax=Mesorhizobium escarrei TaxID=666018 RepID=A0ABM9EIA0_9HYPH|nr:hypothetical protein MES5069_760001 [Mesorhizobium escarrei]